MGIFRFPYRWLPRTLWPNLRSSFYDVTNGIRNIIRWTPVIWFDADFDWEYLAAIMEQKLRWMVQNTEHWHHEGADKQHQEMLACAEAIARLRDDNYFTEALVGHSTREAIQIAAQKTRADEKLFSKLLQGMRWWWD
jgi:hypothetical protein